MSLSYILSTNTLVMGVINVSLVNICLFIFLYHSYLQARNLKAKDINGKSGNLLATVSL